MTEAQLDILERLVKYTFFKSMNELRKMVKHEFIMRGWKKDLKKFKLRNEGSEIAVLLNPRYADSNTHHDSKK
jgi:hypothetical protein